MERRSFLEMQIGIHKENTNSFSLSNYSGILVNNHGLCKNRTVFRSNVVAVRIPDLIKQILFLSNTV